MRTSQREQDASVTSTGQAGSEVTWLDSHFQACEPEYESMLRSVGIRTGWHVLDAGCGAGSFLPLMSELIGPLGRIDAIDLAPENVDHVQTVANTGAYACSVDARVGDLLTLPYPSDTFDAVWNANVSQYFSDSEFRQVVVELRRVTKPGGIIAIKELDSSAFSLHPTPTLLFWRLLDALVRGGSVQDAGMLRALRLHRFLEEAGLAHVSRKVFFIERYAPLRRSEHAFLVHLMQYNMADVAASDLAEEDRAMWHNLCNPESQNYLPNQPDLYWREAHVLVAGIKAASACAGS